MMLIVVPAGVSKNEEVRHRDSASPRIGNINKRYGLSGSDSKAIAPLLKFRARMSNSTEPRVKRPPDATTSAPDFVSRIDFLSNSCQTVTTITAPCKPQVIALSGRAY